MTAPDPAAPVRSAGDGPVAYLVAERRGGQWIISDDRVRRCDTLPEARQEAEAWRSRGGDPADVAVLSISVVAEGSPAAAGDAPALGEALDRMVNTLQARLSWKQAEACVADIEPTIRALLAEARDAAADNIADYVERQGCCGAPSICSAMCQDSAEADAIARAAKPIASLIRTWKLVDRAKVSR